MERVGVDSATLAIAVAGVLSNRWRVGGIYSQSSIWIESLEEQEREMECRKAAEVLSDAGFKIEPSGWCEWLYEFSEALDDEGIEHAKEVLKGTNIRGYVNTVVHHSTALIHRQLKTKFAAVLDSESDPYLVAFESGFDDGNYEWLVLKSGNETIGFLCELIGVDIRG